MSREARTPYEIGQSIAENITDKHKPAFINFCMMIIETQTIYTDKPMQKPQAAEYENAADAGDGRKALDIILSYFAENADNLFSRFVTNEEIKNYKQLETEQIATAKNIIFNSFSPFADDILTGAEKTDELLTALHNVRITATREMINIIKNNIPSIPGGEYEIIKSIRPALAVINNSNIANQLQTIEAATAKSGTGARVATANKGKKGEIRAFAYLKYDAENINISGKPLTAFDKTVHNAICTLYEAGNTYFTPEMVYRAMNGLTNSERITEDRGTLDPIKESIETGRRKILKIDAKDQMAKHYPGITKIVYESYLLPLEKVTAVLHNSETPVECYRLLTAPPLYEYSKNINQVISVDIKLLDTRKAVKNSPKIATFREYLIKRICTMKSAKAGMNSNKIKYATIYAEADIDENKLDKVQKKRNRDQIKSILDLYVKKGFIYGYTEYKKGRAFEGIEIQI